MLRLTACLLFIIAGSIAGATYSQRLRQHTRELRDVYSMLGEIRELIRYKNSTVREIRDELSCNVRYAGLLNGTTSFLTEEENRVLCDTLSKLGTTGEKGQISMLELSQYRFDSYICSALQNEKDKCRLYNTLGFMAGSFIAILVI